MLRLLRIRNLAVIEAAEVEFDAGFNVLTGETGAGKSILIEAVGLLLGGRASADLIRTGASVATVEALFTDANGEIVVRREVAGSGRSRCYVNGALATTAALRDLSQRLVELHGQHDHQQLLDPAAHLPLLDAYAGLSRDAAAVRSAWEELRSVRERLERARMGSRERAARLDLVTFELGEIQAVAPRPAEDDNLAVRRQVLAAAERVERLCAESYAALYESDASVLAGLATVWRRIGELAAVEPQFGAYLDARDGIKSQLEDLAFFLRRYAESVEASAARLQEVEDRLAALDRLKRKYGPTLDDVIARAAALAEERVHLAGGEEDVEGLEADLGRSRQRFLDLARQLSRGRREAARRFEEQLIALLAELAMERCRFQVRFNDGAPPESVWGERGLDEAEFFLSPNPGEDLRPLARIVSGGELSRVMLAIRTLGLTVDGGRGAGKTLVFDEVDAGIGGRVADVVGARLADLGRQFQVLCVTHLAPIAARAGAQFQVEKTVQGGRTVTTVTRLDEAGREAELARMLAGSAVTADVRRSARQLLDRRDGGGGGASRAKAKGEGEASRRWPRST